MSTLKHFNSYISFLRKSKHVDIVFYVESESYTVYFESLINQLIKNFSFKICCVTSSEKDVFFNGASKGISVFKIGSGSIRTIFFSMLDVKVIVMTMPDLHNYHIKRSNNSVHYVYLPHNLSSTHMIYRKGAFDFFDSFFCTGPHHCEELKATEKLYKSKAKKLFEIGYPRLDDIIISNKNNTYPYSIYKQIIIAPSWYSPGIIDTCCNDLIQNLLSTNLKIVLRPHRDSKKLFPDRLTDIYQMYKGIKNFKLIYDDVDNVELKKSAILITDWSGAALSFSLGLCRPVISIDTPRKINNTDFYKHKIKPFEDEMRSEIGAIISPKELHKIKGVIDKLMANSFNISKKLLDLREKKIFNINKSAEIGAKYLSQIVQG